MTLQELVTVKVLQGTASLLFLMSIFSAVLVWIWEYVKPEEDHTLMFNLTILCFFLVILINICTSVYFKIIGVRED